ncbi:hypothetical protein D1AOALGA4SA_10398 [Olavius algarvensis Delta 1 endosymbiont]|nr:hypothetical protein D1AOALGA4SA_10398 [Olavius algarvensis Delta 1 endosymbiont]
MAIATGKNKTLTKTFFKVKTEGRANVSQFVTSKSDDMGVRLRPVSKWNGI